MQGRRTVICRGYTSRGGRTGIESAACEVIPSNVTLQIGAGIGGEVKKTETRVEIEVGRSNETWS